MVSGSTAARRVTRYVQDRVLSWRTGSTSSQLYVLTVLLGGVCFSFVVSWLDYRWMPLAAYFMWLLFGMLLLRFRPLLVFVAAVAFAGVSTLVHNGRLTGGGITAIGMFLVSVVVVLFQSSRQRSGLPGPLSEALLSELKDRLQAQGRVPQLPDGWSCQTAMLPAQGVKYAGDFLVADLTPDGRLEVILVDVCGKGVKAGPAALQFAGALGGLLGALPPQDLFRAANAFLLRQAEDESFATAAHVRLDLATGEYAVTSAGHPPALRWDLTGGLWAVDNARGTALGVLPEPELHSSHGVLRHGEALMFYTDGVVESRSSDLDVGIAWLQETAREAITRGFDGAARRIIRQVRRGDDDRAVLILDRTGSPVSAQPTADAGIARRES